MPQHLHSHDHHHDRPAAADAPALGSYLLAMSAGRRMALAAAVLAGLWVSVGWAVSHDPEQRAQTAAEPQASAGARQ